MGVFDRLRNAWSALAGSAAPPARDGDRGFARELSLERPQPTPSSPSKTFASVDFGIYDRYAFHPGQGLTPRRLQYIYREAELGYPWLQCDLFEDVIETDGHLHSQASSRIDAVSGSEWSVLPGDRTPLGQKAAEVLGIACAALPSWRDNIEHQLWANSYGFSYTEIVWDLVNGWIVPVWLAKTPHRRFRFTLNEDEPRVYTPWNLAVGDALEPGRWWRSTRPGRLIARSGLMRPGTWWSLFKRMSVRDWIIFAERFGLPFVIGSWDENASDEDKEITKLAAASLGKDGWAAMSSTCKLVVERVNGGASADSVQGAIVNLCNAEISKLYSSATLTSEIQGQGSYAATSVHQDGSFELRRSDAARLGDSFQRDIGTPFTVYNGLACAGPRLFHQVQKQSDPVARAKVFATLANDVGLALSQRQVRREFQIEAPTDASDELVGKIPVTGDPAKALPRGGD